MSTAIINFKVSDYNAWKKSFDSGKEIRTANGLTEIVVGRKTDDANMAYIVMNVKDVDKMHKLYNDTGMQKIMQESGVLNAPEITILEQ
jgi:hypothetical protein